MGDYARFAGHRARINEARGKKMAKQKQENHFLGSLLGHLKKNFVVNGKSYGKIATVYDIGGIVPKPKLRDDINEYMDKFLLDYLKANPKKKEE